MIEQTKYLFYTDFSTGNWNGGGEILDRTTTDKMTVESQLERNERACHAE